MTATLRELRPRNRPARAGSVRLGLIAVAALILGGAWLFAIGPQSGSEQRHATPFLQRALGAARTEAPGVRRPARGVAVAVEREQTLISRNGHTLLLSAVGAGKAPWRSFEHGASRPTPFGQETVTIGPERTEEFLTVNRRVGARTWRWRLSTTTLKPELRSDGSIELRADHRVPGLRIAPAAIFDLSGEDVTPVGTRWSLERAGRGWSLALRLDDAELPVPYVIDPAVDYPTPLYLSSTAGSVTGSQTLVATAPSAANTGTSTQPARNATGYHQFNPGAANTTAAAPALNGRGWLADFGANNGATGFPTGNWSLTVTTDVVGAGTAGTAVLAVGMWKGTIAGGVFTSTGNVLAVTNDPAATNIVAGIAPTTTTVTISVPKFKLAASETLLVEIFRNQTVGNNSNNAANRQTTLTVNDGVSLVTHPAADDTVPVHNMSLTPVTGGSWLDTATKTAYYKGDALGSFTLSDALADAGSGPFSVTYPAIGTANWTHNGPDTSTTSPNFTSTTYSWTASPANPAAQAINGVDNALNAAAVYNLNFASDITAPANPTGLALVGGPYYTTASVGLTPTDGADGGSGVDTATRVFERDTVNLAGDSCPAFTDAWAAVTLTAGADTTVANAKCYRYRYKVSDRVGNQTAGYSPISGTAKVDLTQPADPTFAFSALTAADSNGTDTVWYRPTAANGSFTTTATSNDTETTVSSYTFPAAASGWTRSLAGASATYSHAGAPTDPAEPNNVTATNNASNTSNPVSFTVTPDPNPPANMSASITGGYYTTAAINVTLANGNDGAGESGLDATSGVIERDEANLAGDTCAGFPGTWSTVTLDGSGNDTAVQSGKCYRYRYKISDRVGNQGTQAGVSSTAKVDTSGPGAPTLAFSGLTNAWENGSGTVYFKGNEAGGFTVTPSATDAESGVASYAYPALGGSWSNTAGAYTFDSSSPDPTEPNNLHGINGAGTNGADASITVTEDSNAPSGMSASVTAGYVTSTSVAVTLASGSDGAGESGLDPVSELLERDETPLAGGACDPFPGSWSTVTLSGGNDTTVQSGKCYRYRYSISDRVGNQGVSGVSATVKVDTTPPGAPSVAYSSFTRAWENGSGTVYFKGGAAGGFTVTGTASDPESGVASYSFPALGAGWSAVGSGATRTYSFAAAAIDPAEPNDVTATNNAGRTSTPAPLTVTADSTPPDDGGISYVDGFSSSSSLAVALDDGSDAGAGIDTTTEVLERSVGTLANGSCTDFGGFTALAANPALSYDDLTVLTGKCYAYRYVVQDRLGNATTYTTSAVAKVDLDAPAATQGDPGPYLRGSVTLTGTATDAGGSDVSALAFQYSDDSGATWQPIGTDASSPYSVSFDTTTAATPDGVYDLRTVATDGAGSSSPSPVVAARRIDNTAPSASLSSPDANVRAVVNLSATVSDGSGSGISTTTYQFSSDDGATWTTTPASWNTALSSDGMYRVRVAATDNAGNQATDTSGSFRVDNTPPTASMDDPGPYLSGAVNLTSASGDSGSGVDTVTYERSPAGADSWTSVPAAWDTISAADGLYDLRVAVVDLAGNRTDSTPKTGIRVDNTKPNVSLDNPTSNDDVAGTVTLTSTADDTGSGLAGPVTYEYRTHPAPAGPWIATPATWDTTLLADGGYDLRATAVDRAGNSESNVAADVRVDNTPPTIALTAPADGSYVNAGSADPYGLAANANDAGSGVKQVEFFECSDASVACATGTWSSVAVDAAPGPYGADWTITADGHRALRAVATDNADRTASSIVEVTVDRTLPDTAIVTKPGDPSNEAAPTFTFSSTEDSTFECSLDGGAFATCISPHVLPSLVDGTHDFAVRAIDLAGNTDLSAATWTWLTDLTPPTATIDNPGENVRAVVTITSTQDDPGGANASGIASVAFEYSADGGTSWAPTPASWDTAPITDGLYKLRVLVLDNAGNETIDTLAPDVRVDNTAPASSQDDPGQYLRQTVALTGSAADPDDPMGRPGSGVVQVRFEVSSTGADSWTAIGTAATAPYGVSLDTSTLADGRYDFRTVAADAAGNEAPGGTVTNRLVDNTAPEASIGDPGANLRGTVTLGSTTGDPGANASGIANVGYEISSGGGWTPVADNWSTTSVADGLYDIHVVATDRAGNTTTSSPVSGRRVDNTAPSTTDDAPSGYSSGPVTVSLSASDSGSGVSATQYSVDGDGFQGGTSVTIPAPADGSNDGTHTISYFSADVVGNIEATKTTTVEIDATPPVCPACTADDYLTGTETLSATPGGSLSGIKSVTFEYADEGAPRTSPPPGTWQTIGSDTSSPYSVDWDTTAAGDGAYDLRVVIKNNAGNSTTTYLDSRVVDNTAPVAGVGAPGAGALVSGNVTFAATAGDDNPIASVEFRVGGQSLASVSSPPFRTTWDTTGHADGAASLQVVVTDIAGNSTTSGSSSVTIDNNGPSPSLADPGAGVSGNVSLNASSDGDTVRVDIQRSPAGANTWTTIGSPTSAPFSVSFDSTLLVDGTYDLRAVATDQSGHVGTSATVTTRIDNTAPTASLTRPAAGITVGGPAVQLTAAASDSTSGVTSVRFQYRPTGGGGFSDIADDTSAPYAVSWDATTLATGSYDLRVVATDAAANVTTTAAVTVSIDSTAPIVVLDDPGSATLSGAVTLTATTSGSPAARVTFERSPAGASNWTAISTDLGAPWSGSFDTTGVADGLYDLRAVAADALGNEGTSVRSGIRIDNGAPRIVSSTPADGAVVATADAIVLVASEALAAIDGATLDGAGVVAPILSGAQATYPVGTLGPGAHTLAGTLRDGSGKTRAFQVHFTVWAGGGANGVGVEENAPRDRSTTVTALDDSAAATMPPGAWPANGADWLVLRIEMNPAPTGFAGPLAFESSVADVTARWALSGYECHEFEQPLTITIASSATNVAGATREGSAWRILRRVPTPGVLPAGWSDGYWADSAGVHILTLHLSEFAAVRDLTPPASDEGSGSDSDDSGSGEGADAGNGSSGTTTTRTPTAPSPQARLSMRVVSTKVFRPGRQVRFGARIISTRKATGTVSLRNADGSQLATWALKVKGGSNVLTFRMPPSVRKPGRYTLAWKLIAAGDSASQVTRLTIPGDTEGWTPVGAVPPRPDVVLSAPGFTARSLALPRRVRVLKTSHTADAFDLTGAAGTNVRVAVLDVDRLGLNFLHDLHTIFPDVRIVAIANDPALRRRALVAGAAVALPHAAGPARVAAAVRRLARA